jgi:hypothetical protein
VLLVDGFVTGIFVSSTLSCTLYLYPFAGGARREWHVLRSMLP